jgi:hypothetical protein
MPAGVKERTTYTLTIRPEPGVDDEVRALRAWLKIGLRTFGLKCLEITPKEKKEEKAMYARKYASMYVKPDDVRDGPIETRIINVFEEEKYKRLVLELETGSQFALNGGNTNTLIKEWGSDTDTWIGLTIMLELGEYTDWKEDAPVKRETVKVRAISPTPAPNASSNGGVPAPRPLPPSRVAAKRAIADELDDAIPF